MAHFGLSPLVGRDAEVAALLAAAEEARAEGTRCVVVAGEAGIGKTRLVNEAVAHLDPALVLTGHAADTSTGEIPFVVLADTLRDLRYQLGDAALNPAERAVLSPLLPGDPDPGGGEPARIFGGALDLLERLSEQQLVVWVVEDFHWADAATRELVNMALRSLHGRLLAVVTVRTGDPCRSAVEEAALAEQVTSLSHIPGARRLELDRLTGHQVRDLVREIAEDLSPETVQTVTRLSDGVPFVVEELAAARGRLAQASALTALGGRISGLGQKARDLVQAAAVGDHLRLLLLEQVVGASPTGFDTALAEAVGAAVLVCDPDRDQVVFRHALLREAAVGATGPGARRRWHRRWAEVLEDNPGTLAPDTAALAIAEHWHQAAETARALQAAFVAAPAARRACDETRQLRLWQRILQSWEQRDPTSEVGQLTLRQALGRALGPDSWMADASAVEAFLAAARAHPLSRPEEVVLTLAEDLALATSGAAHRGELVEWADHEVDWLSEPADPLTRGALRHIGRNLPPGKDDRAEELLRRTEELDRAWGDTTRALRVLKIRADRLGVTNRVGAAIPLLERALALLPADALSERMNFAGDLCWCLVRAGRHRSADRLITRALQDVAHPEATTPRLWEHLLENATLCWRCTGQWDRARSAMAATARWRPEASHASDLWLARVDLLQRGRTDEHRWRALLGAPVAHAPDEGGIRLVLALAHGARGELADIRRLSAPLLDPDQPDLEGTWLAVTDLGRAEADAAATGLTRPDRVQAEEHLARMSRTLSAIEPALPHDTAAAADLTAQLDRFHGRDARLSLEAALTAWAELDHLPDVAVTHLSLAEAHAAAGDRDTAREHLAEGRRIAAELDARPWLERAAAIARTYGLTTRDRRPDDVLTGREAEVLELLAEGRTNNEIADTLVISPKTASVHVSRIIAKTGATNRTEAVAIARRHGLLDESGH